MIDLGKYAVPVLSAYGVGLVVIIGLVVVSLRSARKAAVDLRDVEARRKK